MRLRSGLLALIVLLPGLAAAQEAPAVRTARAAVQATLAARGAASADLADLAPTDVVFDRRTGATFVYLVQRVNGVPVWATQTPVAVSAAGVPSFVERTAFEHGIAARANSAQPAVEASSAARAAEAYVAGLPRPARTVRRLSDDPSADAAVQAALAQTVTYTSTEPQLVYQPTEDGALRLAWATTVTGGDDLRAIRIDAATGAVLASDDLVAYDAWHAPQAAPASLAPLARTAPARHASVAPSSYRVVPRPFESPSHGPFSLAVNPADPTASPNGWHDTGATQYTITRGNNGFGYADRNDDNQPDAGSSPDGGAGLVFDAVFDPTASPLANRDVAVQSIFYWGNITHDVTWHYGFDEPAGNFQINNFDRGGAGNDAVRLEAQDKADLDPCPTGVQCANNANFGTPADGLAPRMQMYEFTAVPAFEITSPASIVGTYRVGTADFGPTAEFSGTVSLASAATGTGNQACTPAAITTDLTGKVAVITRGSCTFVEKVRSAQTKGAIAVIIQNCDPELDPTGCTGANPGEAITNMTGDNAGDITIPSVFVANSTGETLASQPIVTVNAAAGVDRDSDLDASVITHEYGHGVSTRLVGGPSTSCLGSAEQMGEGWSDYLALMLTMREGDTGFMPRGVGTYLNYEATSGIGIRNFPYSTNISIYPWTYADLPGTGGETHNIGEIWTEMMWEMTWNLIDAHGFSPEIYDAAGTAGNQIAMNLYVTGLKLTPCNPGFVDGRDAILAADLQLYPDPDAPGRGMHFNAIWAAFAKRGLGVNASQGSSNSTTDGTPDFTVPPTTAAEATADGGIARLDVAGANPFTVATTLNLSVDRTQDVRVEMVDLLGRRVALLHDGAVASGAPLALRVSADGLPAGVYVVRAAGETFSLVERVTVVR